MVHRSKTKKISWYRKNKEGENLHSLLRALSGKGLFVDVKRVNCTSLDIVLEKNI